MRFWVQAKMRCVGVGDCVAYEVLLRFKSIHNQTTATSLIKV